MAALAGHPSLLADVVGVVAPGAEGLGGAVARVQGELGRGEGALNNRTIGCKSTLFQYGFVLSELFVYFSSDTICSQNYRNYT